MSSDARDALSESAQTTAEARQGGTAILPASFPAVSESIERTTNAALQSASQTAKQMLPESVAAFFRKINSKSLSIYYSPSTQRGPNRPPMPRRKTPQTSSISHPCPLKTSHRTSAPQNQVECHFSYPLSFISPSTDSRTKTCLNTHHHKSVSACTCPPRYLTSPPQPFTRSGDHSPKTLLPAHRDPYRLSPR